jgi:hypothetical protein
MESRKSFLLRMDPALWAELESWAQEELRSVNGQIEYLLKQAVLKRKGGAPGQMMKHPPAKGG